MQNHILLGTVCCACWQVQWIPRIIPVLDNSCTSVWSGSAWQVHSSWMASVQMQGVDWNQSRQ
jgi:hypothetical protein